MFKLKSIVINYRFSAIAILAIVMMVSLVSADTAVYNSTYTAPTCTDVATECVAPSSLLDLSGTDESNYPNTIDSCADRNNNGPTLGLYNKNSTVTSSDGTYINPGDDVNLSFYEVADTDGFGIDYSRTYYTSNVTSPSWTAVETTNGPWGSDRLKTITDYTLDNVTGFHAFRNIVYFSDSDLSSCETVGTGEYDDIVFYVGADPVVTDTCTYSGTGNWSIDLSDDCTINTNYNLGTNEIILTGTGDVTFNSSINVTNFPEPATSQNIYIDSNAYILVS